MGAVLLGIGLTTSNYQIVISAIDQASNKISLVSTAFTDLNTDIGETSRKVSGELQGAIADFSKSSKNKVEDVANSFAKIGASTSSSIAAAGALGVALFTGLNKAFKVLNDLDRSLRTVFGSGLGDLIKQSLDQAVQDASEASKNSLTDILGSLTGVGKIAIGISPKIEGVDQAQASITEFAKKAEVSVGLVESAMGQLKKSFSGLTSNKAFQKISFDAKFLALDVEAAFQKISQNAKSFADSGVAAFSRVKQLGKGVFDEISSPETFREATSLVKLFGDVSNAVFSGVKQVAGEVFEELGGSRALEKATTLVKLFGELTGAVFSGVAQVAGEVFEELPGSGAIKKAVQQVQVFGQLSKAVFSGVAQVSGEVFSELARSEGIKRAIQQVKGFGESAKTTFSELQAKVSTTIKLFSEARSIKAPATESQAGALSPVPSASTKGTDAIAASSQAAISALTKVEQSAQNSFSKASQSAQSFADKARASIVSGLGDAANKIDVSLAKIVGSYQKGLSQIQTAGDALSGLSIKFSGSGEALQIFGALRAGASSVVESLSQGAQEIFYFSQAFDTLKAIATSGPYELLIGQNVKLQEQLLATRSTLAATNKVLSNGVKISDPGQAIQALSGPVNDAVDNIRKGSLELVNVTSKDLIESFQIVAGEAGNIGFSLKDASNLALSFGATLGTLGVPLYQSRQEIGSILKGQIDQNSVVAKSLGITNAQVQTYKEQGTLVQFLTTKMEAFRAGNKLAAQTIGGVTSNIQELIDNIGLKAGAPLLDPLVKQLTGVYDFLAQNQDAIGDYVAEVTGKLFTAFSGIADGLGAVFQSSQGALVNTISLLFQGLTNAATAVGDALKFAAVAGQPFFAILEGLSGISTLIGPMFQVAITTKLLTAGISTAATGFQLFSSTIAPVGIAMELFKLRGNGILNLFTGLSKGSGIGVGSILSFGASLDKIPGGLGFIASKIPIVGTAVAGLIPTLSAGAIATLGFGKQFPQVIGFLDNFTAKVSKSGGAAGKGFGDIGKGLSSLLSGNVDGVKGIASGIADLAATNPLLAPLAPTLKNLADNTDIAALANEKLAGAAKLARGELIKTLINFSAIGLIVGAAALAVNEFIIKNETNRKILIAVGKAIQDFGEKVFKFLSSPLGIALTLVTGLTLAIQTGLVASTLQAVQAFAKLAAGNAPKWLGSVYEGLKNVSQGIKDTPKRVGDLFSPAGGQKREVKGRVDTGLKEDAAAFEKTVADKKKAIADLEGLSNKQQNLSSKGVKLKAPIDVSEIAGQKAQIQKELDGLLTGREDQVSKLRSQLEKEFASSAPTKFNLGQALGFGETGAIERQSKKLSGELASSRESFKKDIGLLKGQRAELLAAAATEQAVGSTGTANKLKAEAAQVTATIADTISQRKQQVVQLGELNGKLKAAPPATATKIDFAGGAAQLKNLALTDIRDLASKTGTAIGGLGPKIQTAGSAIATGFNGAKAAAIGFAVSLGPIILLTAAIAVATSVYDGLTKGANSAADQTKKLTEAIDEQIKKIKALAEARAGRTGQPEKGPQKSTEEIQAERLKKIKEEQGGFVRALDGADEAVGLSGSTGGEKAGFFAQKQLNDEAKGFKDQDSKANSTVKEAEAGLVKQAELEKGLAELQAKRAEAAAQGNDRKVEDIDGQIKGIQEQVQAGKDLVGITIKGFSETAPLTAEDVAQKKKTLAVLSELEVKYGEVGKAAIAAVDLPRVGSAIEQLQQKVKGGLNDLTKGTGNKEQVEAKVKESLSAIAELRKSGSISAEEAQSAYSQVANSANISAELQTQAQQSLTESINEESKKRVEDADTGIAQIEAAKLKGQISEKDAEVQITEVKKKQIAERLQAVKDSVAEEQRIRATQLQGQVASLDGQIGEAQTRKQAKPNDPAIDAEIAALQAQRATAQAAADAANKEGDRKVTGATATAEKDTLEADAQQRRSELERGQKEELAIVKTAETQKLTEIQNLRNKGEISESEANERRVKSTQNRIQGELAAEEEKLAKMQANPGGNEDAIKESQQKILDLKKQGVDEEGKSAEASRAKLEEAQKKALDVVKDSETKRLIDVQKLQNDGVLSEQEANEARVRSTQNRVEAELELEKKKLQQLEKDPKKNKGAIGESRSKVLELTKQSLEEEQRAYDAHIAKIKEKLQIQQDQALVAIQRRVNAGLQTETEADATRAQFKVQALEQELALETKNVAKRAQLELQVEEAKRGASKAAIAVFVEQQNAKALGAQNSLKVEEEGLNRQLKLYDLLNKALDTKTKLLQASSELNSAGGSFLTGQIDAAASLEKSESKRRQLSQLTAAIKLEALAKEQAIQRTLLEIDIIRNRLALKRRELENRKEQNKAKQESITADKDEKVAKKQFSSGQISKEEFESKKQDAQFKRENLGLLKEEGSFIKEEKALQPQLEDLQRKTLGFKQGKERTDANVAAFGTLSKGEQRQQRAGFQSSLISDATGGQFKSTNELIGKKGGDASGIISNSLTGGKNDGNFTQSLNRNVQAPVIKVDLAPLKAAVEDSRKIRPVVTEANRQNIQKEEGGSPKGVDMKNTFNITVNAQSKEEGKKVGDQVGDYIDKVLTTAKQAQK